MKASELIKKLEQAMLEHGDLDVIFYDEGWFFTAELVSIERDVQIANNGPYTEEQDKFTLPQAIYISNQ